MSKIETIREKYPVIRSSTFESFVNHDMSKTQKYLEYMCQMKTNHPNISPKNIMGTVTKFHEFIAYIDNKDIYHSDYKDFEYINEVIRNAVTKKEDADFQKNIENKVKILKNEDTIFMCRPLTYEASLKYGASTKWCTASRDTNNHFNSYTRDGYLVYVINNNPKLHKNYQKIAFYMPNSFCPMECHIQIFNAADDEIEMAHCVNNGWDILELSELLNTFRLETYDIWYYETYRKKVESQIKKLSDINLNELYSNIKVLKERYGDEMTESTLILSKFVNMIKEKYVTYE